jgi:hypothetical protein
MALRESPKRGFPDRINYPIQRGLVQELRDDRLQYATVFVAALEMRMKMLISIALVAGAVFVVGFWYTNPEPALSRRLTEQMLNAYDDEENEDASDR